MKDYRNMEICPYNDGVGCANKTCEKCGWYPPVADERKKDLMNLKLYQVPFTGYCEVWAKSPEEAIVKAEDVEQQFFAHYGYNTPICLSKEDPNELD